MMLPSRKRMVMREEGKEEKDDPMCGKWVCVAASGKNPTQVEWKNKGDGKPYNLLMTMECVSVCRLLSNVRRIVKTSDMDVESICVCERHYVTNATARCVS